MRMPDTDNDLVNISGLVQQAGGEVITLRGSITDPQGNARARHRIEIWQCDLDGNYMHPRDRRSANFDSAFQGFGHDISDEEGRYVFRTIKPTVYTRAHTAYPREGFRRCAGIADHAVLRERASRQFERRPFHRMSQTEADLVSMVFTETRGSLETNVDIVI